MRMIISYTILTVITVDLLATSGDITMTWTSPMLPKLYSNDSNVNPFDKPITEDEDSWISSLINVGAMIGPFPYGFIAEKFGRKVGLLCIAIPHIISYLTLAFSHTVYLYYFARLLGGIAVGGGYTLLPMYVAEIAEDSNRGTLSVTLGIFWSIGNFLPYLIGPYTSALIFNLILACVPTSFFISFLIIGPESPYYLLIKNKPAEAKESLTKLRANNKQAIADEIKEIQIEIQKNDDKISFPEFISTRIYLKGLIISLVLIIAQQLSGINAVLFYTEEIFAAAGANGLEPEISAMITGAVILGSSFITPFIVDRWGRRLIILISLLGITLSLIAFGIFFYLQKISDVSELSWLPITSLVCYITTFCFGVGPLPWTISSEIFPTNVKSYSATLVSCTCWMTSFFVTKFFTDMQRELGRGETFWLFAGCCFAAFVFTYFFVPETKGKSFQEIQEIL